MQARIKKCLGENKIDGVARVKHCRGGPKRNLIARGPGKGKRRGGFAPFGNTEAKSKLLTSTDRKKGGGGFKKGPREQTRRIVFSKQDVIRGERREKGGLLCRVDTETVISSPWGGGQKRGSQPHQTLKPPQEKRIVPTQPIFPGGDSSHGFLLSVGDNEKKKDEACSKRPPHLITYLWCTSKGGGKKMRRRTRGRHKRVRYVKTSLFGRAKGYSMFFPNHQKKAELVAKREW